MSSSTKTNNSKPKKSLNLLPVGILIIFFLLVFGILVFSSGSKFNILPSTESSGNSCAEGQTRYCNSGGCSGISKCINGAFRGCSWEQICTPNERIPCTIEGCAYAFKTCNICGTGFESCLPFNES